MRKSLLVLFFIVVITGAIISNVKTDYFMPRTASFIDGKEIKDTNYIIHSNKNVTTIIDKSRVNLEDAYLSESDIEIKNYLIEYLKSVEKNRYFSGQILVSKNNKVFIDRTYGFADFENEIKATSTTSFSIGSVTKQFTAAAIIQLIEKNLLSYEDKISKFLSNVPYGDKITIHHLLNHTSGLPNYTNYLENYFNEKLGEIDPYDVNSIDEANSIFNFENIISIVQDIPLDFEPGTNWNYSNTGYLVLGKIVEEISGKTLINYFNENIFEVAGMKNTKPSYEFDKRNVDANGYSGYKEVILNETDSFLLNIAYGAGYLSSTTQDLFRWNDALINGKIISKESLEIKFSNMYGWFVSQGKYGEEISHGGMTSGFTSENAMFKKDNINIIFLSNKENYFFEDTKKGILEILNGEKINFVDEIKIFEISQEQLDKYVGIYEIENMIKLTIFNRNGMLIIQGENQPEVEFEAISEIEFTSLIHNISIKFNDTESPSMLTLFQSGMEFPALKIK